MTFLHLKMQSVLRKDLILPYPQTVLSHFLYLDYEITA